jgi:hypothetical protein
MILQWVSKPIGRYGTHPRRSVGGEMAISVTCLSCLMEVQIVRVVSPRRPRSVVLLLLALLLLGAMLSVRAASAQQPPVPDGTIASPGLAISLDQVAPHLGVSAARLRAAVDAALAEHGRGLAPTPAADCEIVSPEGEDEVLGCPPIAVQAGPPGTTATGTANQATPGVRTAPPATAATGQVAGVRLGDDFFAAVARHFGPEFTSAQVLAAFRAAAEAAG